MEWEQFRFENIDVQEDQKAELGPILKAAFEDFRARYARYLSTQARNSVSEARRLRLSSAKSPKAPPSSISKIEMGRNSFYQVQTSGESACPLLPASSQPTHLADALLHDDPRPGYAGPGLVWLDDEGTLSLARELPGMVLCLKIFYVYQVDPLWNIPLQVVADLKVWLNRQFLASQDITPMPKLSSRAITTSDQVWKLLAQFDANTLHKSAFIRATPVDSAPQIPIVAASVRSQIHPTRTALASPDFGMVAQAFLAKAPPKISFMDGQSTQTQADLAKCRNSHPLNADMSLQRQNQAQHAEIARLTNSIKEYGGRIRSAYRDIRQLRNELRDSQDQNRELREKYALSKHKAIRGDESGTRAKVGHTIFTIYWSHFGWTTAIVSTMSYIVLIILLSQGNAIIHDTVTDQNTVLLKAIADDLATINADSTQQASDLTDDIMSAANNLVNTVEANATIRPGVTERTLWDLQVVVDVLDETARDVRDEPVSGYSEGENDDDGNVDDDKAGGQKEAGDEEEGSDEEGEAIDEDEVGDGDEEHDEEGHIE